MFRVNQKVVCVHPVSDLVAGRVYTVIDAGIGRFTGMPVINVDQSEWMGFFAHRFRPLIERKTSIDFAHEILRNASRKQGVDA